MIPLLKFAININFHYLIVGFDLWSNDAMAVSVFFFSSYNW